MINGGAEKYVELGGGWLRAKACGGGAADRTAVLDLDDAREFGVLEAGSRIQSSPIER